MSDVRSNVSRSDVGVGNSSRQSSSSSSSRSDSSEAGMGSTNTDEDATVRVGPLTLRSAAVLASSVARLCVGVVNDSSGGAGSAEALCLLQQLRVLLCRWLNVSVLQGDWGLV